MTGAQTPAGPGSRSRSNFLRIWFGQGASQFGSEISLLAIPTLAILVYDATPFEASVVGALGVIPFTLFSLPVGPLADRLPRKKVLVACDIGRAVAIGLLALTYLVGVHQMWVVYATAFVVGTCTVFFDITHMSYVPQVVAEKDLLSANAKLSGTASVAQAAGPSLGGLLIQVLAPARTLILGAVSYLASAIAISMVRGEEPKRERPKLRLRLLFTEIREGLSYVRRSPILARIAITSAVTDFGQAVIESVFLVFLYKSLHLPPGQVGIVLAVTGIAFTVGAVLMPKVTAMVGFGRTMVFSIVLGMGIELLTPLAMLGFAFVILVGVNIVGGMTNAFYYVNSLTYRQKVTPDELQGRVHATMRMTFQGPEPFGYLAGGALATFAGVPVTIFIGAVISTLGALILFYKPILRLRTADDIVPDRVPAAPEPQKENS